MGGCSIEPGQVQQGSGEGIGGFGTEQGQIHQGAGKKKKNPPGFGAKPNQIY